MKQIALFFFILFSPSQFLFSQSKPDSLFIRLVVPEDDTTTTSSPRYRIAGSTLPIAKAFINYEEVKVYPSGAFVGMMDLAVGKNILHVTSITSSGDSISVEKIFVRTEPLKSFPKEPVAFDKPMMEPSEDLWLMKGDILEVRFKGSPGYEAVFDIEGVESGIPMVEVPAKESRGIEGVYIGRYIIRETDNVKDAQIRFRLDPSFWGSTKAYAKGKVSILNLELPRVGEVVGRRPYLNVGLGGDRLGGAKYGFIQSGVLVVVTGKDEKQYRVQLADGITAWIPEDNVKLLPLETSIPTSLTGSISAIGRDTTNEDIITLTLSQKLPYLSEMLASPATIAIDVFGATSNTNWITHHNSAKGIESVSWKQVGEKHYRLIIVTKYQNHWGYDISYEGTAMKIKVRRPPVIENPTSPLKGLTIAVDAGHGGDSYGAMGATALLEKDMNLNMALRLEEVLKSKGVNVFMTRTKDDNPGMTDRVERIVNSGAQISVSIHCNSIGSTTDATKTKGVSTYYRYVGYQPLARILYGKMLQLGLDEFGLVGSFNFILNSPIQLPNVLVEVAFMSNPEDEMRLMDETFRTSVAQKIAEGLEEFVRENAK